MFYDCEITIQGSSPKIWRRFTVDANLPVAELTKYIRQSLHIRYHNPHTYCVFRDDGSRERNTKISSFDGPIRVMPCVSWIKSSYALASYFIVPVRKPDDGRYKATAYEDDVTIKESFRHSDRLILEYQDYMRYGIKTKGWSIEIKVLSRDSGQIKHKCAKGKIIEYDSAGYGIVERCGDIDTQNDEQEKLGEYFN